MLQFLTRVLLGESRLQRLKEYQLLSRVHPRVSIALARAAAGSALREIDPQRPSTWEFSGFSQNGEDGIIDYLCTRLSRRDRYFIEIGAANGLENNTSWLAIARRYGGLMIDGDAGKLAECERAFGRMNWALHFAAMMIDRENVSEVSRLALLRNPDVFSLDIDSFDYYVAEALLQIGFRPKIFIIEYNSAFGPERSVTVPYKQPFNRHREHPSGYYFGASVTALRRLFDRYGYRFVTVDANGVNAFFVDPAEFDREFIDGIRGTPFSENIVQRRESGGDWLTQFGLIQHLPLVEVRTE
jgi:hypothetical protein